MSTSNHFQAGLDGRSLRISGCVWGARDRHKQKKQLNDQTNYKMMGKMILFCPFGYIWSI